MSVTNCPSCKSPVPPGAVFCDNCGFDLRSAAAAPQAPAPPGFQAAPPGGNLNCPSCGHPNIEGSLFCENCGSKLAAAMPPAMAPAPPPVATPAAPPPVAAPAYQPPAPAAPALIGRLVIQGANVSLPLPQNKSVAVIGREDPVSGIFPDIDLDPYGGQEAGVGRRHAQLVLQNGQLMIEDLESVNGTVVNRQRIPPRQPHPVCQGDEIRLGKLVMVYHAS